MLEDREDDMYQHPDNMPAVANWRVEQQRRTADDRRLAQLARPRCAAVHRPHRSWVGWLSRPRRTRPAAKPTIA
jgi:hypothetical protein